MKLSKAIEIVTLIGTPDFTGHTEDILAARKLLIEAGKYVQASRGMGAHYAPTLLDGETSNDASP